MTIVFVFLVFTLWSVRSRIQHRFASVLGMFLEWERIPGWCIVTWKLRGDRDSEREPPPPFLQPHLATDSSPRQPPPHPAPGCPVVMFFNYVSLFNVAAAHPYLVNRCNFRRRAEMQPSHPAIKEQIELPQAAAEINTYFYILPGYICNLSHNREIFSTPSTFQGKC